MTRAGGGALLGFNRLKMVRAFSMRTAHTNCFVISRAMFPDLTDLSSRGNAG